MGVGFTGELVMGGEEAERLALGEVPSPLMDVAGFSDAAIRAVVSKSLPRRCCLRL
jgi:hypothetical protein